MWADESFQGQQRSIKYVLKGILNMGSEDHGSIFNRSLKCWSETESVFVV